METIEFDHDPREYFKDCDFYNEKGKDETKLLEAYRKSSGNKIKIKYYSDLGARNPAIYEVHSKVNDPQSIEDFEYKLVGI